MNREDWELLAELTRVNREVPSVARSQCAFCRTWAR